MTSSKYKCEIENYGGGIFPSSQIKAMKTMVGKHTFYFSYDTLIGYCYDGKSTVITNDFHSSTTSGHKYSIPRYRNKYYVPDWVLKMAVESNVDKTEWRKIEKHVNKSNLY